LALWISGTSHSCLFFARIAKLVIDSDSPEAVSRVKLFCLFPSLWESGETVHSHLGETPDSGE
jgi:hypothetical protein